MAGTLSSLVVRIGADIKGFQAGIASVHTSMGGLGAGAMLASGAIVGGFALAGGAAIKMAGDFQSSMTSLVTGAGESKDNLALVSKGILAMAGDVGMSTSQLAAGMYMIESAGYHGADGLTVLKTAAQGAKVGSADLATVADALTSALNAYHMPASEATAVTNDLIATVASGKMHMQDLAGSLGAILPAASTAGVSLAEVSGAIATMTMQGTPAADAATYLRQTILQLENPSAKAAKAMEDVGLKAGELGAALRTKGLSGALEMATDAISKKFTPGSSAYIAHLADMVGGTKSMQAALELTGANMETFKNNIASINDAVDRGGNSVAGWADVQGDFNYKWERTVASLQAGAISIGMRLLPAASAFFDNVVQPAIPKIVELSNRFIDIATTVGQNLAPAFRKIGAVLGPLASGLERALGPFLSKHADVVLAATAGVIGGVLVAAMAAFAIAAWAAVAPMLPFIAVGAAVAVTAYLIYKNWQPITAFFSQLWAHVLGDAKAFWATWGPLILALGGPVVDLVATVVSHFDQVKAAGSALLSFIEDNWSRITAVFQSASDIQAGILEGAARVIEDVLTGRFGDIANVARDTWNRITGDATSAWSALEGIAGNLWGRIADAIVGSFSNIHIPTPHLQFNGGDIASLVTQGPGAIADLFSVNWYAKGGIFTRPTILGNAGVGEAGPEGVLPLRRLPDFLPAHDNKAVVDAVKALPRELVSELVKADQTADKSASVSAPHFSLEELASALYELMSYAEHGRRRGHRRFAL